jgi:hypothetical protein
MPNSGIAESRFRELCLADSRERRLPLRPNVLQLLQRTQRGFHQAILFLIWRSVRFLGNRVAPPRNTLTAISATGALHW